MKNVDKVIYGKIYTGDKADSVVGALAISGDSIVYTGDRSGIEELITKDTEVINVPEGKLVMPGFMDGHCHIGALSAIKDLTCVISEEAVEGTSDMIIAEMREYIKAKGDRAVYIGHNWYDSAFENNCPTADLLDTIETERPIVMMDGGGHSYWVNTNMLKLAGITKDTPDPVGGKIERYPDGTPKGCFRDTAIALIQEALPVLPPEQRKSGLIAGQELYKDYGYTALFEALTNEQNISLKYPTIEAYQMLEDEGKLELYTQGSYVVNNDDSSYELLKNGVYLTKSTEGGRFEVTAIKIFMDGVVEGATALLSKEYAHKPGWFGAGRWTGEDSKERLAEIIEIANELGIQCHVHAIGDQAITDILDAFQKVYNRIGEKEKTVRNAITHLQVVKPSDIPRFKELGIVAVINPWACKAPGMYEETEAKYLGEERASHEFPYRSFLDAGVMTAFATDFGCSFTADPIECFHVLTTRTYKDDDPATTLGAEEKFTRLEAAKIMTYNVAYQMKVEDKMGSLEPGKLANLVILSKDLLTIPDNEIMSTQVLSAMSYGKWTK